MNSCTADVYCTFIIHSLHVYWCILYIHSIKPAVLLSRYITVSLIWHVLVRTLYQLGKMTGQNFVELSSYQHGQFYWGLGRIQSHPAPISLTSASTLPPRNLQPSQKKYNALRNAPFWPAPNPALAENVWIRLWRSWETYTSSRWNIAKVHKTRYSRKYCDMFLLIWKIKLVIMDLSLLIIMT